MKQKKLNNYQETINHLEKCIKRLKESNAKLKNEIKHLKNHNSESSIILNNDNLTWKEKYERYLLTNKWKSIRLNIFERDHFCCKRCGKKFRIDKLNAHHLTYKHVFKEDEYDKDLVTLCWECHKIIHNNKEENMKFLIKIGHNIKKL